MRLFGGFSVGRWFGFEVRIDYSWFLILFLLIWTLGAQEFPRWLPNASATTSFAAGTAAALLLFLSVLLHELSHASVARARGVEVESITLFIFGGVAQMTTEATTAADEFLLTAAGPLSSLAIGVSAWGAAQGAEALGAPPPVVLVANAVALANVGLAIFNMVPGFPLDGGRIFRSAVWGLTGDLERATRWATRGGQLFGWLLIGLGAHRLWVGDTLNGLWGMFIGWFLSNAASSSWTQFRTRQLLSGVSARRVMNPEPVALPADMPVDEAIRSYFLTGPYGAYPVVGDGGVVGLVGLEEVAEVPAGRRATTPVSEAMRPVEEVPTVGPSEPLDQVLQQVRAAETDRALVVEEGRLVGVITLREIGNWLERVRKLGIGESLAEDATVREEA